MPARELITLYISYHINYISEKDTTATLKEVHTQQTYSINTQKAEILINKRSCICNNNNNNKQM